MYLNVICIKIHDLNKEKSLADQIAMEMPPDSLACVVIVSQCQPASCKCNLDSKDTLAR